ncbi:hypothetical protein KGQ34_04025 [Patescibacteria group bacterium]|nr:hypothetical protein [Patescibacteria group bacterium]
MATAKIRKEVFWGVVCGMFVVAAGLMFWLNYSFDQETKIMFADAAQNAVRPEKPAIDTSLWKIYENKKFGFSFKYPPELQAFPCTGVMLFCLNVGEKNLAFQDNGFAVRIYDRAKLQSRDESGFGERIINGISWRMRQDSTRAFRMDFGSNMQIRIFAISTYSALDRVVATFGFTK